MAVTRSRRRALPSLWQSPDPALTTALLQHLSTSNWFGVKTGAHLDGLLLVGQMACLSVAWHEAADDWRRDYSAKEQTIACSSSSILGFLTRHHHRDLANALDNALSIDWHPSRFTEQLPRISGIRVLLFESNSCPPRNITSGEVTRFLVRYSQLERVEIDFANALDNDLLVALGKHCSQLREVADRACTESHMHLLSVLSLRSRSLSARACTESHMHLLSVLSLRSRSLSAPLSAFARRGRRRQYVV